MRYGPYTGKRRQSSITCGRTRSIAAAAPSASSTCAIRSATCSTSGSLKPRVVEAGISTSDLSLIKALADQVTAAVPTFIGNYIVLGALPSATALLGIQTAVDFVHDYSIELAWNVWGPQRLREEPTIDFPAAGAVPAADND